MRIVVLYDKRHIEQHDTFSVAQEEINATQRVQTTLEELLKTPVPGVEIIGTSREATLDEIKSTHHPAYVDYFKSICESGGGYLGLDDESYVNRETLLNAVGSAGLALEGIDILLDDDVTFVYALTPSPGHHAGLTYGGGLCYINNVALAAKQAKERYGLGKILIIDWDSHFGNGTYEIFKDDPDVFTISIHEYPQEELHINFKNKGFFVNDSCFGFSLPPRSKNDYIHRIFQEVIFPLCEKEKFDITMISSGLDSHWKDTLGVLEFDTDCFGEMTSYIKSIAEKTSTKKILMCMEGGYNPENNQICNIAILKSMAGQDFRTFETRDICGEKRKYQKLCDSFYSKGDLTSEEAFEMFPEEELKRIKKYYGV